MKVYAYYYLADRMLYAFTTDKEKAKVFESQRDMSCFVKKIFEADPDTVFTNTELELIESPLFDGVNNQFNMILTIKEDNLISEECDRLHDELTAFYRSWEKDPTIPDKLKKKVLSYLELFDEFYEGGTQMISNLNTFHICVKLFHNTFLWKG